MNLEENQHYPNKLGKIPGRKGEDWGEEIGGGRYQGGKLLKGVKGGNGTGVVKSEANLRETKNHSV